MGKDGTAPAERTDDLVPVGTIVRDAEVKR